VGFRFLPGLALDQFEVIFTRLQSGEDELAIPAFAGYDNGRFPDFSQGAMGRPKLTVWV